jgi:lipoate-protein ligase A
MYVFRGRVEDPEADRDATAEMLSRTARNGEPTLRVWTPHRQVAFGRRDVRADEYEAAAEVAREAGFDPYERSVGGRAVAYTGSTVAFARAEPVEDIRSGMNDRYEAATTTVQRALWKLDVPAQRGEPTDTFCPGDYSLSFDGKLAGIAQRVRKGAALVSGVIVVDGHAEIAEVLEPVYEALDVPFEPDTVGSIERVGGRTDRETVIGTVEDALVGDREPTVREIDDVPESDGG